MQSMGDNMNKVCQTIGCAQKRAPPKLGQNGQQNLSRGPADPIDTSDEALEQSEALIDLSQYADGQAHTLKVELDQYDSTSTEDEVRGHLTVEVMVTPKRTPAAGRYSAV